jgi:hypothetical protein
LKRSDFGLSNGTSFSSSRYTFVSGDFILAPVVFQKAIRWIETSTGATFPSLPVRPGFRLIDAQSQTPIADLGEPIPSKGAHPTFLKAERGFLLERNGQTHYFDLPPKRNWPWLAAWSLVPPASLFVVAGGLRRVIRRFKRPPAQPSTVA